MIWVWEINRKVQCKCGGKKKERKGKERKGKERKGKERKGKEKERKGKGKERKKERNFGDFLYFLYSFGGTNEFCFLKVTE